MCSKPFKINLTDGSLFDSYCFICGESITDSGINLLDAKTLHMGLLLPEKLGDVIGDKYIIVVAKEDKVCSICLKLMNHLDELEYNLFNIKQKVIQLLQFTHKLVDKEFFISQEDVAANINSDESLSLLQSGMYVDEETCIVHEIDALPSKKCDEKIVSSDTQIDNSFPLDLKIICNESETLSCKPAILNHDNENVHCNRPVSVIFDEILEKKSENSNQVLQNNVSVHGSTSNATSFIRNGSKLPLKENCIVKSEKDPINCLPTLLVPLENYQESNSKDASKQTITQKTRFHPTTSTKDKIYVCTICDVPFPKPYLLSRHTRIHQKNSGKITCSICNFECHDHLHYLYHRKNEHDLLKRLSCPLCEEKFPSNKELRNHVLTRHEGEQFSCNNCGETFKRFIQFENHKLYSHGNKNCRICGKHISSVVKLRQHENRHAWIDSKKLSCEICGRVFKTPSGLRVHKVSHTGNYKFFCEFCGRGFMSTVLLEEHKGVHTKEDRYICDTCGRKFVLYSTFHLHKQWHKDPFPFPCHICKKKFRYRSVRSTHIKRDHNGENPYKCNYCNAEFLKLLSLKKHISKHTKEYPFSCIRCQKGFHHKRTLVRHLAKIHNDESLLNEVPTNKPYCLYKVILPPDEFPKS